MRLVLIAIDSRELPDLKMRLGAFETAQIVCVHPDDAAIRKEELEKKCDELLRRVMLYVKWHDEKKREV